MSSKCMIISVTIRRTSARESVKHRLFALSDQERPPPKHNLGVGSIAYNGKKVWVVSIEGTWIRAKSGDLHPGDLREAGYRLKYIPRQTPQAAPSWVTDKTWRQFAAKTSR